MSTSANVTSIAALKDLRTDLLTFSEESKEALVGADMEIRRTFAYVQERIQFWQREVIKREQQVGEAKVALNRKKIERIFGRKPDVTEEEKAYRRARMRHEEALQRVAKLRRWGPILQHAVTEYEGPARQLATFLEVNLEKAVAQLERGIDALEEYVRAAPSS